MMYIYDYVLYIYMIYYIICILYYYIIIMKSSVYVQNEKRKVSNQQQANNQINQISYKSISWPKLHLRAWELLTQHAKVCLDRQLAQTIEMAWEVIRHKQAKQDNCTAQLLHMLQSQWVEVNRWWGQPKLCCTSPAVFLFLPDHSNKPQRLLNIRFIFVYVYTIVM